MYYSCLIIVDVFRYGNIYALTPSHHDFVSDPTLQAECQAYISSSGRKTPFPVILELYAALRQGTTVKEWALANAADLQDIDIRRFTQFGIIKGFLYRVHKFPVLNGQAPLIGGRSGRGRWDNQQDKNLPLTKFLDGAHHFDEICTELQQSEQEVMNTLAAYGDVQYIHR